MMGIMPAIIIASWLVSACASPQAGSGSSERVITHHPPLDVHSVEYLGVKAGLVRGIVGAPEEMLDTAVRNAGSFGPAEARDLRYALRAEALRRGFDGDAAKGLVLRVRVATHLARVGELWPAAEFLIEAEYTFDGRPARGVFMYCRSWFYWSMQSLRRDVLAALAGKIVHDVAAGFESGAVTNPGDGGHTGFFNTADEAREEFFE